MNEEESKQASEMLNFKEQDLGKDPNRSQVGKIIDQVNFARNGTVDLSNQIDGASLSWNIKPKVSVSKLLQGKTEEAFEKTSLAFEFNKQFKESDVEVIIKVNGDIAGMMKSPSGTLGASFSATKRF